MPQVEFKPITRENWRECIKLKVKEEQKGFVAPNDYSLLQAYYETENHSHPYGIYDGETMVGFVMSSEPEDIMAKQEIYIHRFMIAAEYQGKGYGKVAMQAFVDRLKAEGRFKRVLLSYEPENTAAAQLYESVGFKEKGIHEEWGEMIAVLELESSEEDKG